MKETERLNNFIFMSGHSGNCIVNHDDRGQIFDWKYVNRDTSLYIYCMRHSNRYVISTIDLG